MDNNPEGARSFFAALVKNAGARPNILLVLFAQPREVWEEKFPRYTEAYRKLLPAGIEVTFEMALPDKLAEQVKNADIIYCHGGDDHLAQYWFKKTNIVDLWQDKTVGVNSATTHALAAHFWTCDWRQCMDGLGVLPVKVIAHYGSSYGFNDPRGPIDWEESKVELAKYGDSKLPIYALKEGEFVEFTV